MIDLILEISLIVVSASAGLVAIAILISVVSELFRK